MKNKFIMTPLEIQRLYEYSLKQDDNVVISRIETSIGDEYYLQTQNEMWHNSDNRTFITDWESW